MEVVLIYLNVRPGLALLCGKEVDDHLAEDLGRGRADLTLEGELEVADVANLARLGDAAGAQFEALV